MRTLGDLLGKEQVEFLVSNSINIGDVFRMKLTEAEGVKDKTVGDNGRNKHFIVLGVEKGVAVGLVLINSEINENLEQCLKDLHYPLKVSDYPFLEKNRFACCGELKSIALPKFTSLFGGQKGSINDTDLRFIKEAVKSSPKVTPKELKKFGLDK